MVLAVLVIIVLRTTVDDDIVEPLREHPARGTHSRERDVTRSHEQLIESIDQVERTVHIAARHVVMKNVHPRDWRLRRNGGSVELVKSVHDTPLAIWLTDTERGRGVRRLALTHHACLALRTEERVNDVTLFLWLRLVPRHSIEEVRRVRRDSGSTTCIQRLLSVLEGSIIKKRGRRQLIVRPYHDHFGQFAGPQGLAEVGQRHFVQLQESIERGQRVETDVHVDAAHHSVHKCVDLLALVWSTPARHTILDSCEFRRLALRSQRAVPLPPLRRRGSYRRDLRLRASIGARCCHLIQLWKSSGVLTDTQRSAARSTASFQWIVCHSIVSRRHADRAVAGTQRGAALTRAPAQRYWCRSASISQASPMPHRYRADSSTQRCLALRANGIRAVPCTVTEPSSGHSFSTHSISINSETPISSMWTASVQCSRQTPFYFLAEVSSCLAKAPSGEVRSNKRLGPPIYPMFVALLPRHAKDEIVSRSQAQDQTAFHAVEVHKFTPWSTGILGTVTQVPVARRTVAVSPTDATSAAAYN
ncbi:hypothetical protein ON010_g9121 [Phytophthora cinnamomi]|nr:hypothetical protein ON010_g9121 [Phytophthora cinnamomi]